MYTFDLPVRERWAARSMTIRRWLLANNALRVGEPICELAVDGALRTVACPQGLVQQNDYGGVVWRYVDEGNEVGPWGQLLAYALSGLGVDRLHQSARRPLRRRPRYPKLFLSYRREDGEAYAGRLHESLKATFGLEELFLDQFSIQPGEVFPWTIQQAAVHATAMIVLIGPRWRAVSDAHGGRSRLFDERDFVLREIAAALDYGTMVIPVLLPGGTIPIPRELPDELTALPDLQFFELSSRRWDTDVTELKNTLRGFVTDDSAPR